MGNIWKKEISDLKLYDIIHNLFSMWDRVEIRPDNSINQTEFEFHISDNHKKTHIVFAVWRNENFEYIQFLNMSESNSNSNSMILHVVTILEALGFKSKKTAVRLVAQIKKPNDYTFLPTTIFFTIRNQDSQGYAKIYRSDYPTTTLWFCFFNYNNSDFMSLLYVSKYSSLLPTIPFKLREIKQLIESKSDTILSYKKDHFGQRII